LHISVNSNEENGANITFPPNALASTNGKSTAQQIRQNKQLKPTKLQPV